MAADPTPDAGADDATTEAAAELAAIRLSIDNIDAALVHMLAERFKFTQKVGRLKASNGMPASDPERERVQIARLREIAMEAQLDPAFAEKWFNFVVAEVIHHHEQLATGAISTQADAPAHRAQTHGTVTNRTVTNPTEAL